MVFQVSVEMSSCEGTRSAKLQQTIRVGPSDSAQDFGVEIGPIGHEVSGLAGLEGQANLDLTSFRVVVVVVDVVVDVIFVGQDSQNEKQKVLIKSKPKGNLIWTEPMKKDQIFQSRKLQFPKILTNLATTTSDVC